MDAPRLDEFTGKPHGGGGDRVVELRQRCRSMTLRALSAFLAELLELLERELSDTAREIRHLYRIIRNTRREMHDARR
ncbi:hypothetical protein [Burkholderia sp. Se-20378]|nr:hypothetical protein [Burkholderia sp. Se-20378]